MTTTIDGSTGIVTQAIDVTTPITVSDGGTGLSAAGSAGNVLVSDGTSWSSASKLTYGTLVNTTSGTTADFTGIPSWAKRVNIILNEVAVSGSDTIVMVLGTASSLEITGYISTFTSTVTYYASTTSFEISQPQVALSGIITLDNISGNTWIASGAGKSGTSRMFVGGGSKTLASALTRLQIKMSGANTFTAGSINIFYE